MQKNNYPHYEITIPHQVRHQPKHRPASPFPDTLRAPHTNPLSDRDIQHALVSAPQDRRADFLPEFPIRPEFGHHVKQLCREHSHNIGVFTHPARCRAQEQASKQRLYSRPAHTISPRTPSSSSIFTKTGPNPPPPPRTDCGRVRTVLHARSLQRTHGTAPPAAAAANRQFPARIRETNSSNTPYLIL